MKHKIEWTDWTWNPVHGCHGGCDYCYAREIDKRLAGEFAWNEHHYNVKDEIIYSDYIALSRKLRRFDPVFMHSRFNKTFPKSAKRIFVNSMSDIAFWELDWIRDVFKKIREHPGKVFQILTKFPEKLVDIEFPENVWLGISAESQEYYIPRLTAVPIKNVPSKVVFVSFEPLHGIIDLSDFAVTPDWIIIGCQSGRNRPPFKLEWAGGVVEDADAYNIPVFVKQLEINGKVTKDINQFPKHLQRREFPG